MSKFWGFFWFFLAKGQIFVIVYNFVPTDMYEIWNESEMYRKKVLKGNIYVTYNNEEQLQCQLQY